MLRENNQAANKTWVWTYDDAGNILSRTEYNYTTAAELSGLTPTDTVVYGYTNPDWGDLLTSYDGNTITYDTIGNPLTDGTWTYTWQNGRELASMTSGNTTWSYTYDANGMRKTRTNGTDTYTYLYNGSQLVQMTRGTDVLYFDHATGTVTWTDTTTDTSTVYYYVHNLQGDVVAILNSAGTAVVNYAYDAWGNLLATTGSMASTLGVLNPLTYRSYTYDHETGLYYLQSRYYNPEIGRFINADMFVSTGQGLLGNNMFAYCNNSPVCNKDSVGGFLCTAIGTLVGGALGAISAAIEGKTGDEFWASVASGAVSGAVSGVAADVIIVTGGSAAVVAGVMAGAGALGAVAGNSVESLITGDNMSWEETVTDACWGAATGALFGYMGGEVSSNLGKYASRGFWKATRNILIREGREVVSSVAEEALAGVTAGLMEFVTKTITQQISNTIMSWK